VSSLIQRLANDLVAWMDAAPDRVPRRVLLWLDPDRSFMRLAEYLGPVLQGPGIRLLRYGPEQGLGQLSLKLELLRLEAEPEARAVVYLPGFETSALSPRPGGGLPRLWGVCEYRYKGCVWGRGKGWQPGAVPQSHSLTTWLRGHGVTFADERTQRELAKGGADSLLARYAQMRRETDPVTWPAPLRSTDVLAALSGDPREHLRALLAAPANTFRRWQDEQVVELALERVREEFGLASPEEEPDPEELADAFAIQLALVEAYNVFGEPADFPYWARLPQLAEQRRRAVAFLRDELLPHVELGPRFLRRMRRLERNYPLADWAENRNGQPLGLPLLAEERWRRFLAQLQERVGNDWRAAARLLDDELATIEAGARLPDHEGTRGWRVAQDLAKLLRAVSELEGRIDALKNVAAAVGLYADEAWQVGLLHLRIRAACVQARGPEVVRKLADLAYFEHVSCFADRFCDLVGREGSWPPADVPEVGSIRKALWSKAHRRKAVIVTDGLRLDLARMVEHRLELEGEVSLDVVATTLPSNTPFGMVALLPLPAQGPAVSFVGGKASISAEGVSGLETRDGRKAFFLQALGGSKGADVGFLDLAALLQHQPVPDSQLVVVFDNTIDEQGHKGTEQFPLLVEQFVDDLRRAILLLHEAGVAEVHVVTDHGFLMLPPELVDSLGRPEVLPVQALHKDARWAALKPDAPVHDVLRLPLPLAPEAATLGFPQGVRTLVKAEAYLHGGISPQECVIPHLLSRIEVPARRLNVEVAVTTDRLSTGVVPVVLKPRVERQLALKEPTVTVRLWVEVPGEVGGQRQLVTEPLDVPVRADAGELRPPLYLKEGLHLPAGQELLLRAVDRDTGRELGAVALRLIVDWD
jgi:hypothetical protein